MRSGLPFLADISGMTGQNIIKAILAGQRDPRELAAYRDYRVKATEAEIAAHLEGHWQEDLLFVLQQEQDSCEFCQQQMSECDRQTSGSAFSSASKCGISPDRISRAHPFGHSLFQKPPDRSAVLEDDTQPRGLPHHWEIDSAKTKTRQENIEAIPHMVIVERRDRLSQRFRAVGVSPAVVQFGMRFFNRHLQRSVGHGEGNEIQPVPRAREASRSLQSLVQRRCG